MEKAWKILENNNIILRKPEPEDLDFLYSIENNSNFWFVSDTKAPFSRWQLKEHIENTVYDIYTNKELRLIIELKSNNEKLGVIDLFDFDPFHQRTGLGILINKDYQNKGIASESIELVRDYCFDVLDLNQLWCNIDKNNIISINLFEKNGFIKTGVLKSWKRTNKNFVDVYTYQLLNEE